MLNQAQFMREFNETHRENFSCKSFSTTTENEISGGKTFNIYKMEVYQILNE